MDEREIEQGYANFHRKLNHILRTKDVRAFKAHIAAHPRQAGRLSHCLGLNDELAEIEMFKAILVRRTLEDLHQEARMWLESRGISYKKPGPQKGKFKRHGKRKFKKRIK